MCAVCAFSAPVYVRATIYIGIGTYTSIYLYISYTNYIWFSARSIRTMEDEVMVVGGGGDGTKFYTCTVDAAPHKVCGWVGGWLSGWWDGGA